MEKDYRPQNTKKNKLTKIKPFNFFIIFVAISSLIAFLLGGYFIGKDKTEKKQNNTSEITEQVKINTIEFPNNPQNWKTYKIKGLEIELKLPKSLTDKGDFEEKEIKGEEGRIICIDYKSSDDNCDNKTIIITSVTKDFQNDESLSIFSSSKGFVEKNQEYYVIGSSNNEIELGDTKHKIFSQEDYEIIKILGSKDLKAGLNEEQLGAIINLNNKDYPALVLIMNINENLSEYEFDQILKSVQKTTNE